MYEKAYFIINNFMLCTAGSIVYGYGYMKIPKCKKQRISYITLIGNDCKPIWGYVIPR